MHCRFAVFALVAVGFGFALGCQQQPSASQGGSEHTKQVTVGVEGMT